MFVGITFPFFGGLLGFFGGFAFAPTTYFVSALFLTKNNFLCFKKKKKKKLIFFFLLQLPCIMWLAIYKPKKFSLSWITNWVCKNSPQLFTLSFKFFSKNKISNFGYFTDLYHFWCPSDDYCTNWRAEVDNTSS